MMSEKNGDPNTITLIRKPEGHGLEDLSDASEPIKKRERKEASTIIDDPCWGGPREHQHSLSALLQVISSGKFPPVGGRSDNIIIHNSEDFLVIDKPPDLRMDGPYPATVHKLTTFWFPPPSLIQTVLTEKQSEQDHDNVGKHVGSGDTRDDSTGGYDEAENIKTKYRQRLLEEISKLANHGSLQDNIIRTTHQLDYATSGVLFMAKSRRAAAKACEAFANRSTRKEYLSIVHHKVDAHADFKILDGEQEALFRRWMDGSFEDEHRKMRRNMSNRKGETFVGYLPAHSVFAKWKGTRQKRRKRKRTTDSVAGSECDTNGDAKRSGNTNTSNYPESTSKEHATESQMKRGDGHGNGHGSGKMHSPGTKLISSKAEFILSQQLKDTSKDEEDRISDLSWKEIKQNSKYKALFHDLTKAYNEALKQQKDAEKLGGGDSQIELNNKGLLNSSVSEEIKLPTFFRIKGESQDAFYVHAALADDPNSFRVYINPDAIPECSPEIRCLYGRSKTLDGKELTFKPSLTRCVVLKRGFWNGYHVTKMLLQPRTGRRHQLRLHMAILGSPILGDCTYAEESNVSNNIDCDRMCLHAHKLTIPLGEKKMKAFVAPDPFVGLI